MQLEPQRDDAATAEGGGTVICHNCRTALVPGMRFCRGCGYRLGEGVAEYVETVRFGQSQVAATMAAAAGVGTAPAAGPFGAPATTALQSSAPAYTASRPNRRRNRWHTCSSVGSSWWLWVVIAFAVFIAAGGKGAFRSLKESVRGSVVSAPSAPRSFFGTSGFETADGRAGALLEAAEPGGPADVAGLVGGDIVTSFD
ncbi:MAG: hypothetical protein ACRD9R_06270, partial [Pyrinomonadaceae bacterium]